MCDLVSLQLLHGVAAPLVAFGKAEEYVVATCVVYGICSHIAYTAAQIEIVNVMERAYGSSTATLQVV